MADFVRCFYCKQCVGGYVAGLRRHLKLHLDNKDFDKNLVHYSCMQGGCRMSYRTFGNLKQHILKKHPVPKHQSAIDYSNSITLKVDEIDNSNVNIEEFHEESAAEDEEHCTVQSIREFVAISICRLKADVSFTDKKIQEVISFGESIIGQINDFVRHTVSVFVDRHASHIPAEELVELQNSLCLDDVFKEVKTPAKQQNFLIKLVGPTPESRTIMLREKEGRKLVQGKQVSTKVIFF